MSERSSGCTTCVRPRAPRPRRPASVAARAARAARPPVAAPRARRPARACSPAFEGGQMPLHMRLPKLKGFRNRFRVEYQVVNVGDLGRLFPDGGEIGPEEIAAAGAVRRKKPVKVLGKGELVGRADRERARVLGQRRREDHGRGRLRPPSCNVGARSVRAGACAGPRRGHRGRCYSRLRPASRAAIDTGGSGSAQRIPVGSDHAGPAKEDPLHARDRRGLPHRGGHPVAGRVVPERPEVHRAGRGRRQRRRLLPDQPVLRRCAAAAVGVRAGHHALHHVEHHHPAAHRGHPAVRAAEEGRPVGSEQADPVHPLPDDRARRPAGHRHHRPRRPRPALRRLRPARASQTHSVWTLSITVLVDDRGHRASSCGSASRSPSAASATACRC